MKSNMSRVSSISGDAALGSDTWATPHQAPFQPTDPRLRVLVFDDEAPARNHLVKLIETTQLAEVVGAVASANEARQALEASDGSVDVAFIDMSDRHGHEGGGLELVRSIAPRAQSPMFVLATEREQHAVEAFELGVTDYVLKPFHEGRIAHCLRRLRDRRRGPVLAPSPKRIVARRRKSLVFLEPDEVWAFEATDRLTFVHSRHGKFDLDLSLASIEEAFGSLFTRVHRSWLVNAGCVRELERDAGETRLFVGAGVADSGAESGIHVPVARERAQSIRELLLTNATGLRRM
jgi:two-component system response regulator LytT